MHKKTLKVPTLPNQSNIRQAYLEKHEERELWHKLVVKILCWKDGILEGGSVKIANKITAKEWKIYHKRMMETNLAYGKEKALANLRITQEAIKNNGGFEQEVISSLKVSKSKSKAK